MKKLETPFEAYEFTEEEFPVAAVFSEQQECHIKTELAAFAAKKVTLSFQPSGGEHAEDAFILEHEYLRGACDALSSLLNTSDDTKTALAVALQEQHDKQNR